jgi:hypothetical protein
MIGIYNKYKSTISINLQSVKVKKWDAKKKDFIKITKYTFHYLIHNLIFPALVKKMSATHHNTQVEFLFSICQKVGIDKTIIDNWLRENQTFSYDIRLTRLFVKGNWELFKAHFETVDAAVSDLCPVPSNSLMEGLLSDLKEKALNIRKRNRDSIDATVSTATTVSADATPATAAADEEPSPKRRAIELSLLHPDDCPAIIDLTRPISPLSPMFYEPALRLPDGNKDGPDDNKDGPDDNKDGPDDNKDEDIEDDDDSSSDYTGSTNSSAAKKKQKKLKLPYTGGIDANCCQAISLNYNTYVQCRGKLSVKKRKLDEMAAVDPSFPGKICNACFKAYKKKAHFIGFIEDRDSIVRNARIQKKTVVDFNDTFLRKHFPGITMLDVAREAAATNKYYDKDWGVSRDSAVNLIFGNPDDDDDDDDDDEESGEEEG